MTEPMWPIPDGLGLPPNDLQKQIDSGWPDHDSETVCNRCGAWNMPYWWAHYPQFNRAMTALGLDSGAIVCPLCFIRGLTMADGDDVEVMVLTRPFVGPRQRLTCPQCQSSIVCYGNPEDDDRPGFIDRPCVPCLFGANAEEG